MNNSSTNESAELEKLRDAYREHPEDRDAGTRLGQYYADMGWLNEAEEVLADLSQRFPQDYSLLLDYGNLCFRRLKHEDAFRIFRRLTVLRPERIEGWNNLGIVQLTTDDREGARVSFSRVLELESDNFGALLNLGNYYEQKGELGKAVTYFQRAVAVRKDFADGWYNLGNAVLKQGDYEKAIEAFEKALRYQPEFASALKNLGYAHEQMGDSEAAEECYDRALELNKADAALYVNLATIYTSRKEYDRAKDYFLRAVKLAPKSAGGWMGLRHLSLLRGDITTFVRATLAVVHRLSPGDTAQSIRHLRELGHVDEAAEILKLADRLSITSNELDAERLLVYGGSKSEVGKVTAIAKRLEGLAVPSDSVRRGLGGHYVAVGDFEKAASVLDGIEKKSVWDLRTYWTALECLGKWAEVRASIEAFLRDHEDYGEGWLHLARAALGQGRLSEAQAHLVRARGCGLVDIELLQTVPELKRIYEALGGNS